MNRPTRLNQAVLAAITAIVLSSGALWAAFRYDSLETKTLDWLQEAAPAVSAATRARAYFDSSSKRLRLSQDGGTFSNLLTAASTDTVTGKSIDAGQLTGNLAVARFNGGTAASASSYWRGDGTWATLPIASILLTFTTGATNLSAAADNYFALNGPNTTGRPAIRTSFQGTASMLTCKVEPAPSAGKSYLFNLVESPGNFTGIGCTIADAATQCSDNVHTFLALSELEMIAQPTGTPTAAVAYCTLLKTVG